MGNLSAASYVPSPEQQKSMDARNAHNVAYAKQLAAQPALSAQRRRDEIAANQAFLDSGGADIPENYWGDIAASKNWVNPYYNPNDPRVLNPGQYNRFDPSEVGSGIADSGNGLATAFDRTIASQWLQPLDSGLTDVQEHLYGGGAGAFTPPAYAIGNLDPRQRAIIDHNKQLAQYKTTLRGFQNDRDYQAAFRSASLDLSSIKNAEDLADISPEQKAAVYDNYQRIKQEKNQRVKPFGFGDALGAGLSVVGTLTANPYLKGAGAIVSSGVRGGSFWDMVNAGGKSGFLWNNANEDYDIRILKAANTIKKAKKYHKRVTPNIPVTSYPAAPPTSADYADSYVDTNLNQNSSYSSTASPINTAPIAPIAPINRTMNPAKPYVAPPRVQIAPNISIINYDPSKNYPQTTTMQQALMRPAATRAPSKNARTA